MTLMEDGPRGGRPIALKAARGSFGAGNTGRHWTSHRRAYSRNPLTIRETFWPPKPKLLLSA